MISVAGGLHLVNGSITLAAMDEASLKSLSQRLRTKANPKAKAWWQRYVKDGAPFLGVKMADIRTATHEWFAEEVHGKLDADRQLEVALSLFFLNFTEEKLAGVLALDEILLPANFIGGASDVRDLGGLFAPGGIYDWNVCDWFSIKVLGSLIRRDGLSAARKIGAWRSAPGLWKARSSLVAFVPVADIPAYRPLIERGCNALIRREERFAKTAVGWILREMSRHDRAAVSTLLNTNIRSFSREALKNATKHFPQGQQASYVKLWTATQRSFRNERRP